MIKNQIPSFFKDFAQVIDEAVFFYDVSSARFLEISPAFEKLWEISSGKILDSPDAIIETIHNEDKQYLIQKFNELKDGEVKKKIEFRISLPDQTYKWIALSAYTLRTKDDFIIAGYCNDVSDQKEYLFQLLKINSKKNSTMEILSHDLAGPLGIIQNLAHLIEKKGKIEEVNIYTGMIKETCKRSISLITEFVNQEFLESVEIVLKKDRVDLVERISSVINFYKMSEESIIKNFELISSSEKIWLEIDDVKFMQVINNLISNAIKFTPDNGKILVSLKEKGETIEICVEDDGIGIPLKYHPYLFEKFTKARREGLRGEKSVGLGMSIIKTIVELHKGEIWFESEEGKGSKFFIDIPRKQS